MRDLIHDTTRSIEDTQTAQALHGLLSLKSPEGGNTSAASLTSNLPALLQAIDEDGQPVLASSNVKDDLLAGQGHSSGTMPVVIVPNRSSAQGGVSGSMFSAPVSGGQSMVNVLLQLQQQANMARAAPSSTPKSVRPAAKVLQAPGLVTGQGSVRHAAPIVRTLNGSGKTVTLPAGTSPSASKKLVQLLNSRGADPGDKTGEVKTSATGSGDALSAMTILQNGQSYVLRDAQGKIVPLQIIPMPQASSSAGKEQPVVMQVLSSSKTVTLTKAGMSEVSATPSPVKVVGTSASSFLQPIISSANRTSVNVGGVRPLLQGGGRKRVVGSTASGSLRVPLAESSPKRVSLSDGGNEIIVPQQQNVTLIVDSGSVQFMSAAGGESSERQQVVQSTNSLVPISPVSSHNNAALLQQRRSSIGTTSGSRMPAGNGDSSDALVTVRALSAGYVKTFTYKKVDAELLKARYDGRTPKNVVLSTPTGEQLLVLDLNKVRAC